VREAFEANFARRDELGGACCVYRRGEKVVDLWGGIRNGRTGEPWEQDTMVIVHSATKGLAAMTIAMTHSRGWLDYEERVVRQCRRHGSGHRARLQRLRHRWA
jgi:CubicO group peptidase (beta-lactamase class C family)